jgi:alpha-beta hydrolase superfamily lysophospholipase
MLIYILICNKNFSLFLFLLALLRWRSGQAGVYNCCSMNSFLDKRRIRKILVGDFTTKRLVRSLVFIYACLLLFLYLFSDRIIFWGKQSSYKDGPEILKIKTKDRTEISALYLVAPNSEFTILYSHGNSEDIGDIREFLEMFRDKGFSILAYDYRGYGTSDGCASEKNAYEDIEAAYEYLVGELENSPDRIIAMGRSMGGAVAMHLACREKLAGLILESSFITAFRVITRVQLIPFDKFRNIDKIKKVQCPVLVIHGKDDRVVPFWHGERLFETANEPKYKFWVDGAGHNDLFLVAGNRYWDVIKEFTDVIRANRQDLANRDLPKP